MVILKRTINYTTALLLVCFISSCSNTQISNRGGNISSVKPVELHNGKNSFIILNIDLMIKRPVEEVFAYLTDPSTVPEWQTDISRQIKMTEGPMRVGTILLNSKNSIWGDYEYEREIIDFVPLRIFNFYSYDKSLEFKISYELESVNSDTKVDVTGEFKKTEVGLYRFIPQEILKYAIKKVFLKHNKLLKMNIDKIGN
jgi:polyketide cyclase/dehydrase/lipid transport protein